MGRELRRSIQPRRVGPRTAEQSEFAHRCPFTLPDLHAATATAKPTQGLRQFGGAENYGHENDGPSKCPDMNLMDVKLTNQAVQA